MTNPRSIVGFHPVREVLRHRPHEVQEVLCSARPGKRRAEIEGLCARHRVSFRHVPVGEIEMRIESADQVHNGFLAAASAAAEKSEHAVDGELVVLVEDVQDPRNLGALLRVCEGAGVGQVLIRDRGSAPLTAAAIKTSAGASEHQPIERITNSTQEIQRLQKEGFWVYGADAEGEPPWQVDLTGKVVICIGGEADGLRERTRKSCDGLIGLPMRGRVASLNLATAASALLYDAVRQRLTAEKG